MEKIKNTKPSFGSILSSWGDDAQVRGRLLVFPAILGAVLLIVATNWGAGVGGDATIYISSANNLLAGKGLGWIEANGTFRLLPYSPPLYPLVLSLVGLPGFDLTVGARCLNVLFFFGLIYGCTICIYRVTSNPWLATLSGLLVAFSPVLLGVQVWAMSEGLFLLLSFIALALILIYIAHSSSTTLLWAGVIAGLAFLTRYMGAAVVAGGGLALLLLSQHPLKRRVSAAIWFGILAILPVVTWGVISVLMTGTLSSRSAQPASMLWQRFLEMSDPLLDIYLFWVFPGSVTNRLPGVIMSVFALISLVALIGWVGLLWRTSQLNRQKDRSAWLAASVTLLFIGCYLAVLAVVQVFTFPPVTIASRMLSPVHLAVIILIVVLAHLSNHNWGRIKWVSWVTGGVLIVLLGSYILRGTLIVRDFQREGIGYTGRAWQQSQVINEVRKLPANIPLVTNDVTAVYYLTGRPAYPMQEIYAQKPLERFHVFGEDTSDPGQVVFRQNAAALVLFGSIREDLAFYGDRLDERLAVLTKGLYLYYPSDEGWIYFYQAPAFLSECDICRK